MKRSEPKFDALQIVGLILLSGVLLFLGVMSFANRLNWQEPTDGVVWQRIDGKVVAVEVQPDGPAADAGIHVGDVLKALDGQDPLDPAVVEIMIFGRDVGEVAEYDLVRDGRPVHAQVVMGGREVPARSYVMLAFIGLAFLGVGVFALLRQPDAASRRFFLLAVGFFMLLALSPTTRAADPWNDTIRWLDQLARDLVPGLFLLFSLTFPREKKEFADSRGPLLLTIFAPGVGLFLVYVLSAYGGRLLGIGPIAADRLLHLGERLELLYLASALGLGVLALAHTYKTASDRPLERMRLKWLVGGVALGFLPFVAVYVPLSLFSHVNAAITNLAVIPMVLVPLSFGYAVVGFRLWDVEVLLKRAVTYVVTATVVLCLYFGVEWALRRALGPDDLLAQTATLVAMLIAAVTFAPLRNKLRDLADRWYYRERYRARRTLMDFARELNSETDLSRVVELLVGRVRETIGVGRVALLLRVHERDRLRLVTPDGRLDEGPTLSSNFSQFVAGALARREFLYVDDMAGLLEEFPEDREVLEAEDLAYFLPLEVKDDVIGVLALGRKLTGDYLSTEDLEVLRPLAAHVALAIDNALLYREVQKRAIELVRLKEFSENVIESIQGGVMVVDPDGVVQSWNRSLARIYGIEPQDAVGRPLRELFPARFVRVLDEARDKVHDGLEPLTSAYRIPLRTRTGKERVVTLSMAPLLGEHGSESLVIILDDVTERTELESQLRQAEKLTSVGLLAAGVAHEVNTPLAGISSYVQMLQRKLPETDPRRAVLEKIEKQTFRASQIVNNLLNFSRQETGEMRLVHWNDVVSETLALAEIQLRKRRVRVVKELSEQMPPVMGDPIKLQQVLMNLLLNSRDAMPSGGEIYIRTRCEEGDAVLEVEDTGSGIAEENLDKVYDPFFTTKGVGKGTGLGLSVSYGIIQEHRGTIAVESEPGKGTTFRIALPVADSATAQAAAS